MRILEAFKTICDPPITRWTLQGVGLLTILIVLFVSPVAATTSTIQVLDNQPGVSGLINDMVINSSDIPIVAYEFRDDGDLYLTICDDPLCNTFSNIVVDSDPVNLLARSISIDLTSTDQPVVAYDDFTNNELKLLVCADPTCSSFNAQVIDNGGGTFDVGAFNDIVIDTSVVPNVAYIAYLATDTLLATNNLRLIDCQLGATLTCNPPRDIVLDTGPFALSTSMVLNASNLPVIAYQQTSSASAFDADLRLLTCTTATCDAANQIIAAIDDADLTGFYLDLELDPVTGFPILSYRRISPSSGLYVATCGDVTCSTAPSIVLNQTLGAPVQFTSLIFRQNVPTISYWDLGPRDLVVGQCVDVVCSSFQSPRFFAATTGDVGRSSRLRTNSSGDAFISYSQRFAFDDYSLELYRPGECFARNTATGVEDATFDHQAIQNILNGASAGQTITVAGDCVGETDFGGTTEAEIVYIDKNTTLNGGFEAFGGLPNYWDVPDAANNTLQVTNPARPVYVESGLTSVSLTNMTLTGGNGVMNGGGLFNNGSTVTLDGLQIENNQADMHGGGLYNDGGTLALSNTTVQTNTATSGDGGGFANDGGTVNVVNSFIGGDSVLGEGNTAGDTGGGFFSSSFNGPAIVTLNNSDVNGNTANGALGGGGFFNTNFNFDATTAAPANNATVNMSNGSEVGNTGGFGNVSAAFGGGFHNYGTNVDVIGNDVTVAGNRANTALGGGFANQRTAVSGIAEVNLTNADIRSNLVGTSLAALTGGGGGFYNFEGRVRLDVANVEGNQAVQGAGGLSVTSQPNAELVITNSAVIFNVAQTEGGGLAATGGTILENVTVSANLANTDGGGVWLFTTSPVTTFEANFVTFNNNLALGTGDGLFNSSTAGLFNLTNSLVNDGCNAGMTLDNAVGSFATGTSCGLAGASTPGTDNANILLGVLATNAPGTTQTHELQAGSDGIDGAQATCPTLLGIGSLADDQRGVLRPQGSACDAGAYER